MDNNYCCPEFIKFIQNFDLFGREARLYYNDEEKKTTWFGYFYQ